MRIYFLSAVPAALKLNGLYLGVIDKFERRVDIGEGERVFAEAVPADNSQSLNFFIDAEFIKKPPQFCDVYLMGSDALIYLKRYPQKETKLRVYAQKRLGGCLATLYGLGAVFLSCEAYGETENYELDDAFAEATLEENSVNGFPVILVRGKNCVAAVSESGKLVFMNAAENCECGSALKIRVKHETCANLETECEFSYDGTKMTLVSSTTRELAPPAEGAEHFAFFESALTRSDCAKYLCEELKPKAKDINAFLGDFIGVTVPPENFFAEHGEIRAAGLVYAKTKNLFEVKYFAVNFENGRITNVYEIE